MVLLSVVAVLLLLCCCCCVVVVVVVVAIAIAIVVATGIWKCAEYSVLKCSVWFLCDSLGM